MALIPPRARGNQGTAGIYPKLSLGTAQVPMELSRGRAGGIHGWERDGMEALLQQGQDGVTSLVSGDKDKEPPTPILQHLGDRGKEE